MTATTTATVKDARKWATIKRQEQMLRAAVDTYGVVGADTPEADDWRAFAAYLMSRIA